MEKKEWSKFVLYLNEKINDFEQTEQEFIKSYLAYLKSVIEYEEVDLMNLSNISSLHEFYKCIKKIVKQNGFEIYSRLSSAINEEKYGLYCCKTLSSGENLYLWFGMWLSSENKSDVGVFVNFDHYREENWVPNWIAEKLQCFKNNDQSECLGETCDEHDSFWIKLKDDLFKEKFCTENIDPSNKTEQQDILDKFFKEILGKINVL